MKKAFSFIESLTRSDYELLGYPTLKIFSDYTEVYFDCFNTIRSLGVFNKPNNEFRMFAGDGCITIVFTFYND